MTANITDTQLEMLSRRWAEDPSPHLALRLANVYRQREQLEEALSILEKALEARPNHVSIQVALGRYRLEAGDSFGAAKVLRSVVDRDPGHLVANKLLVSAHLGLGDRKSAADRLELYSLLNDTDPDLETLRAAVENAGPGTGPPPLPESFEGAGGEGPDLAGLEPPGLRSVTGALDREPFAALQVDPSSAPELPGFFSRVEPAAAVTVDAPLEAEPEAEAPVETTEPLEVEVDAAEPEGIEPETVEPEGAVADEPEVVESETTVPDEVDPAAGATSTLGALYLAQGHVEEARQTFERVLERDPEDAEARAGLDEIERREAPVEAVEAAEVSSNPRIERLESYLGRIRAAAERLSA